MGNSLQRRDSLGLSKSRKIKKPKRHDTFDNLLRASEATFTMDGNIVSQGGKKLMNDFVEALRIFFKDYGSRYQEVKMIFEHFQEDPQEQYISKKAFLKHYSDMGILKDDPRISSMVEHLQEMSDQITFEDLLLATRGENMMPNPNIEFITKVANNDLLISEFPKFSQEIRVMFNEVKKNTGGQNATYIPELANVPSDNWGVAICTVEGQRIKLGHANYPFSIQSCSKPLSYAFAMQDLGSEKIHSHVGQEPSGVAFNALIVNKNGRPHNPCINAGAIMIASLVRPDLAESPRFSFVLD